VAVSAVLVLGLCFTHRGPSATAGPRRRPNILIIVTDDQRARGTLGVMPKTMRIFRRGGTSYTQAFATTPLCCPSRASIYTGRYAHNHNVRTNWDARKLNPRTMIQHQLQRAGYNTGVVGKLNMGGIRFFDKWATVWPHQSYYGNTFNINGRRRKIRGYSTNFVGAKSVDFLEGFARERKPWYLVVAPFAPHSPAVPARKYARADVPGWSDNPATREADRSDKPLHVQEARTSKRRVKKFRRRQLRTLMSVDDMVSRIFRKLRSLGEENTLAFFLSDHGYLWFEHGLRRKEQPYEDSVRIPFFVRWPGHFRAGATKDNLVATIDIAPTVYRAARVGPSYTVDGWSLLGSHVRRRLLLEHWAQLRGPIPTWKATWSPSYEYIEYPNGGREFYDQVADPWQLENLYGNESPADDPVNGRALRRRLRADARCRGRSCP
jgi:arylsulfatase A-like enzyme